MGAGGRELNVVELLVQDTGRAGSDKIDKSNLTDQLLGAFVIGPA